MSRNRLADRLRRNADFQAMTRYLDQIGLGWRVVKPNHKGHPALAIALPGQPEPLIHHISSTPGGWCNTEHRVAKLKRALAVAGWIGPPC